MNAKNSNWSVVNEFGGSKTYIDRASIQKNGTLIRASVRYALSPPGNDRRNGKPVQEMLMSEEYDIAAGCFRIHRIQFIYTDGSASEPLSTEPAWKPAIAGNQKTLEFLQGLNRHKCGYMKIPRILAKLFKRFAPENESKAVIMSTANIAFPRGKEQIKDDCNTLSPSEDVDLIVNLCDCNGKFWGSVKFSGDECLWIAKPGDGGGLYATMLFVALTSARKKLSPDDRDQFSRWAGLPRGSWTEKHYSEFAFSCVKWLSIPDAEIEYNENLKRVKEWLAQSGECSSLNRDFSSAMRAIFSRVFVNN